MKSSFFTKLVLAGTVAGTIFLSGCATKNYVKNTVTPVSGKLDQVAQQSTTQGQEIDQTKQALTQTNQSLDQTKQSLDQTRASLEKDETALNATNERAVSAGTHADDANRKADQLGQQLGDLKTEVANLDDYSNEGTGNDDRQLRVQRRQTFAGGQAGTRSDGCKSAKLQTLLRCG